MLIGCLFLLPLAVGCRTTDGDGAAAPSATTSTPAPTTAAAAGDAGPLRPELCEYIGEWVSGYSTGNRGSLRWTLRSVGSDRFEGHALVGNSTTGSSDTPRTLTLTRSAESAAWRFSMGADRCLITGTLSLLSADRIVGQDDRRTSVELDRVTAK